MYWIKLELLIVITNIILSESEDSFSVGIVRIHSSLATKEPSTNFEQSS